MRLKARLPIRVHQRDTFLAYSSWEVMLSLSIDIYSLLYFDLPPKIVLS